MICISDYKDLKVGDQFINKYDSNELCEIIEIDDFKLFKHYIRFIKFIFLNEYYVPTPPDITLEKIDIKSQYAKECFIIHRNKNLDILLNDSTSAIT